jgi:hypothetical protein
VDNSPSVITLNFLLERNELLSLIKLDEKCNSDHLYSKSVCHIKPHALKRRARKPNWHGFNMIFSSACLWIIFRMTFSNSLPVVGRRLTVLKF